MSEFKEMVSEGVATVKKKSLRFLLYTLLAAVVFFLLFLWVSAWTYSDGTRAGDLIKVSRKGVVFKTYEGQLNLGGFQSDVESGLSGNIWDFSTSDKDVYHRLQELEGKKVKLHYKQRYRTFPWQGKTVYFVDHVDLVK